MSTVNNQGILDLLYYPKDEGKLRELSTDITTFNKQTKDIAKAMLATMEHYQGIGLAAPQIGKLARLFVMENRRL